MEPEKTCDVCGGRWAYYAGSEYYGGHAVCAACVEMITDDLGCECLPDFHENAQYCETAPTDETVARVASDLVRERKHAIAARAQGQLAI